MSTPALPTRSAAPSSPHTSEGPRTLTRARPSPQLVPLKPEVRRLLQYERPVSPRVARLLKEEGSPRVVSPERMRPSAIAINRAMHGLLPEADGVDVDSLRKAEETYLFVKDLARQEKILPGERGRGMQMSEQVAVLLSSAARSPNGTKRFVTGVHVELSERYNAIGMGCLDSSPLVAQECLQRALVAAPKGDPMFPTSICNLAALHLRQRASRAAIRYLLEAVRTEAVSLRGCLSSSCVGVRGRVRLNLSSAYSMSGQFHEALDCAREADSLLEAAARATPAIRQPTLDSGADRLCADLTNDAGVLRAMALHNCCVYHEFLGQHATALVEARKACRVGRHALADDDPLMLRLVSVEESIAQRVASSEVHSRPPSAWQSRPQSLKWSERTLLDLNSSRMR